jgi:hypothetical protein
MQNALEQFKKSNIFLGAFPVIRCIPQKRQGDATSTGAKRDLHLKHAISTSFLVSIY